MMKAGARESLQKYGGGRLGRWRRAVERGELRKVDGRQQVIDGSWTTRFLARRNAALARDLNFSYIRQLRSTPKA